MTLNSVEEGLAMLALGTLSSEEIPELALLLLSAGVDSSELAALAGSLKIDHPADLRNELDQALRRAGTRMPGRLSAAHTLKRLLADRAVQGLLSPRAAASSIIDVFQVVERELPPGGFVGESFGIATLVGLYYSYDDVRLGDEQSIREIDEGIAQECQKLAAASGA